MRFFVVALVALASIAVLAASSVAANNVLKVKPGAVNFGTKPVGSSTIKSTTLTNTSDEPIVVTLSLVRSWDDFAGGAVGSTCPGGSFTLAPGESCTLVEAFFPSEDFEGIKQDQIWVATATDPQSGALLETEEIVFFGRGR
jgi:Cep192 domain 4